MPTNPEEDIEYALFHKAKEYTGLPLNFPNEVGDPAATGHVVITHFRNNSEAYTLSGDGCDKQMGILQFLIKLPLGTGSPEMRKRGGDIAALFWTPANLVLTRNATRITIAKRPVLGTALPTKTYYEMTVRIEYEAFI
jgi:hypothetical protein